MTIKESDKSYGSKNKTEISKSTAIKSDQGKPPMSLLPWPALTEVAKVLDFGAKKYTRAIQLSSNSMLYYLREELERWSQKRVSVDRKTEIQLYQLNPISFNKELILETIQSEDPKISPITFPDSSNLESIIGMIIRMKSEKEKSNNITDRLIHYYHNNSNENPFYAKETLVGTQYILIVTIKVASEEDVFVINTTTVLESLKIAFEILREQYDIFATSQLVSCSNEEIIIKVTGVYNWKMGMEWSRMSDAALRHLSAWIEGEDIDKESGLNHLAHCACCILFLASYQILGIGKDDRWHNK